MTDEERASAFKSLGDELEPVAKRLWVRYADLELQGLRKAALSILSEFLREMQRSPSKSDWTWRFCNTASRVLGVDWHKPSFPIRQPLLKELLLPMLVDAYRAGRTGAAAYIAFLNPRLEVLASHNITTNSLDLLREALRDDPGNRLVRQKLMNVLYRRMDYVIHEAPHHGVLEADTEEDIRWANELEELAREAGEEQRYANFIFRYRYYTAAWSDYIQRANKFSSFVSFLSKTAPYASLREVVRRMDRSPVDD